MAEGGLRAPERHPVDWKDADFADPVKLDAEMRRVFDICHGCRRCFNLCQSFPKLFDLVDESPTGELDSVKSEDFASVVDLCTLCDMCFMTKCPYVPPHEFNLDFPHLMLRYRAVQAQAAKPDGFIRRQLKETDFNGRAARLAAPLINWATRRSRRLIRRFLQWFAGIHRDAELPEFHFRTLEMRALEKPAADRTAPARERKVALYATCFANYNSPAIGEAALAVLARNGIDATVVYPECCGMPQLEAGDLARVSAKAERVAARLAPWIDQGYDIVTLVPSCALMLKTEWPLLVPGNEAIRRLSKATRDISEYIVDIAKTEGLAPGLRSVDSKVTLQLACHARAQNVGPKAAEMLRLIPSMDVSVIERCSGHGGAWGVETEHFPVGLKVGRPVARDAAAQEAGYVVSECPLARDHVVQGMEAHGVSAASIAPAKHPIEIIAEAYRS